MWKMASSGWESNNKYLLGYDYENRIVEIKRLLCRIPLGGRRRISNRFVVILIELQQINSPNYKSLFNIFRKCVYI